jgi:predicted lipoprotein
MMKLSLYLFSTLALLFASCKDKVNPQDTSQFKKEEMLRDLGEKIILPNYQDLQAKVNTLQSAFALFQTGKSSDQFAVVQNAWEECVLDFHKVKIYEFGPAAEIGLRAAFGTFPTDTVKINDNIFKNEENLASAGNTDAIGLAAVEYLLFKQGAFDELKNNLNSVNYLSNLIGKMSGEIDQVLSAWSGSYMAEFQASTGTSSTSSFSLLVNEFNKEYELAKNAKLGIPIGKKSLGIAQKNYVEAPYSAISLKILQQNIKSLKKVFKGEDANGTSHKSFSSYLIALDKSSLVDEINRELDDILSDLDELPLSLNTAIDSNPEELSALYDKMHALVIHFKTDMTSAFGVLITYQDNDGD